MPSSSWPLLEMDEKGRTPRHRTLPFQIKNPPEGRELVGEDLCRCAHYVARLKTFWAFEQIELDGLAFIQ